MKWWRKSRPIRFSVQNTSNQVAHKNGWVWSQKRGKSEGYEKWNKKKIQGTNSEGKKTGNQINDLEQKEEINIQLEQNEEKESKRTQRIQKNKNPKK